MKTPSIKQEGIKWLKKQGWKIINHDFILFQNKLEEYPYKAHVLAEKNGYQFFINFFNKDDYFYSKTKKFEGYVTGFEWWKYKFSQTLEILTGIPVAVVFHNQLTNEFIFRQLNQLPEPTKWRVSYCLAKRYRRPQETLQCYICWKKNPQTTRSCLKRKTKSRPMAVWPIDNFAETIIYQSQMFTKKYEQPKTIIN